MRWNDLFEDLEARMDAAARADREAELPEIIRAENAETSFASRLRGHQGAVLSLQLGAHSCQGEVVSLGAQWLVLEAPQGVDSAPGQIVVPYSAITAVRGLGRDRVDDDTVLAKLPIGHVYRALSRDRQPVMIGLWPGYAPHSPAGDPAVVTGTIDRVGRDHIDVAEHAADVARRPRAIRTTVVLQFGSVAFVRSVS
ncbi:hypothetical protein LWF01_11135 [Saxibacter everestensis]|uniref:Uncharacterized protein n=1 Tax=Saxibacter everestensis TaxID=2909229 RepID=A0ABY8QRB3_9MICO|nr:hypothetical protein LWF01_11135 [Brevibacteriaceae bacterium ZFBP1038]